MKKSLLLSLLIILAMGINAQDKNNIFTINGLINGKYEGNNKVYLVKEDGLGGKQTIIDSAKVENNRYQFKGIAPEYTKMFFIKSADEKSLSRYTPFFIEPGTITIVSDAKFFLKSEVSGTINNDIFRFYNLQTRYALDSSIQSTVLEWTTRGKKSAEEENNAFRKRGADLSKHSLKVQRNLVERFYDHAFAPFIILWEMVADVKIDELKVLRNKISPSLAKHPYTVEIDRIIKQSSITVGNIAPDFKAVDLDGNKIRLSDFKGKYVLIDFWASWCGPCIREMPNVKEVYKANKSKNFEIIGVSLDNKKDKCIKAVKSHKMKWRNICDADAWNSELARLYNVKAIPYTVLIDPNGKIVNIGLRGDKLKNTLKNYLK